MSYKTKICFICGMEYQPRSSHQKYCAQCRPGVIHERQFLGGAQWRMNHREQKSATDKAWRIDHHEQYISMNKAWAAMHPEQLRLYRKRFRAAHPEKAQAFYAMHSDVARIWRLAHPNEWASIRRKHEAKRRVFGFNPLNSPFPGCEGHHPNKTDVIYEPKKLHRSVYHNQWTGKGMVEANALAGQYLTEDWT